MFVSGDLSPAIIEKVSSTFLSVLSAISEKTINRITAKIIINNLIYDWFFPLNLKNNIVGY
jgi:hypothetical protein